MAERVGLKALANNLKREAPQWAALLPQLPRLLHQALDPKPLAALREEVARLRAEERRQTFWVKLAAGLLAAILVAQLVSL